MDLYREPGANGFVKEPARQAKALHLVKANQEQVQKIWPLVRRGCLSVKAKTREHDGTDASGNWTPEHIRAQIELGYVGKSSCELWLITDGDDKVHGFLVTVISNCPYLQVPLSLMIWVAYTVRPIGGRNARAILGELEEYAKKFGLLYVDGYTNRPEWAAWLKKYGRGYRSALALIRKNLWD